MQVEGLRIHPGPPPRVRVFGTLDLHITLGFLGSVPEADARRAWDQIGGFRSFRRVSGSFSGVEPLGHREKPSALCALVGTGRAPLVDMIAEARGPLLEAAGAPEDHRPPLPHMTLARIQRRATAVERRQALRWAHTIDLRAVTFTAASVALYTWADDRHERLFQILARHELSS